ncbi:MAG TPA: VOC family protein [Usitatibacter sp.]|nr:VOC family protein [Usitatibacter sp.]
MRFALDHVVIAVADLERTIADYRSLGFTVEPGGRHPGRTSHNALVVFEDGAYLELIAWTAPNPAERWNVELAKHGEGLMDFALIPEDVPRAIEEAKSRGLALSGPIEGGRVRPDGRKLEWRTGRQSTFDLPFLCGDITPRELRVPTGGARRHANGAIGAARLVVAVHDLDASLARYQALLGRAAEPPAPGKGASPGLRTATLGLDGCALVLATPAGEPCSAFDAEVRQRLSTRGDGPCALALQSVSGQSGTLDRISTHGAPIELVPRTDS